MRKDGQQLNSSYDQLIGPFNAGNVQLDLFGQIEFSLFSGGTLNVTLDNGTMLTADLPPASINPSIRAPEDMSCSDTDGGVDFLSTGTATYSIGGAQFTSTDYCNGSNVLAEMVCGGGYVGGPQLVQAHTICAGKCENGAC